MELTLESLGIDKEQITGLVVEGLVDRLMVERHFDDNEGEHRRESTYRQELDALVRTRINEKVTALADEHLLPRVVSSVENLVLQETNKWGERKGEPVSFVEYLVARAEDYIREEVDHQGKSKEESGSYTWSKNTTRITYLINRHLQFHIENAVKAALKKANEAIVGGLEAAVKLKLQEVAAQLDVKVKA